MERSLNFQNPLPVLPVYDMVYMPGQALKFTVPSQRFHRHLFNYAMNSCGGFLAVGYLYSDDVSDYPNCRLHKTATILELESCTQNRKNNKLVSWTLKSVNGTKAFITGYENDKKLIKANLDVCFENYLELTNTQSLDILLRLWTRLRELSAVTDCFESTFPSCGNKYFSGYIHNIPRFLDNLYKRLPLTFEERIKYLSAQNVISRSLLMAHIMSNLHSGPPYSNSAPKYRTYAKLEAADLKRLRKINPNTVLSNN